MAHSHEANQEQDESRIVKTKLRRSSKYEEMMQDEEETNMPTFTDINLNDTREKNRHSLLHSIMQFKI